MITREYTYYVIVNNKGQFLAESTPVWTDYLDVAHLFTNYNIASSIALKVCGTVMMANITLN